MADLLESPIPNKSVGSFRPAAVWGTMRGAVQWDKGAASPQTWFIVANRTRTRDSPADAKPRAFPSPHATAIPLYQIPRHRLAPCRVAFAGDQAAIYPFNVWCKIRNRLFTTQCECRRGGTAPELPHLVPTDIIFACSVSTPSCRVAVVGRGRQSFERGGNIEGSDHGRMSYSASSH